MVFLQTLKNVHHWVISSNQSWGLIFVDQGQMLSVRFCRFLSLTKKTNKGPRNSNEQISLTDVEETSVNQWKFLWFIVFCIASRLKGTLSFGQNCWNWELFIIHGMKKWSFQELTFKTRSLKDRKLELNWWRLSWGILLIRFKQF